MSHVTLEEHVFSKPYFDREGLIVAVRDEQPIGFVHAAFGPSEDKQTLDRRCGIISLLMVEGGQPERHEVSGGLIAAAHSYLAARGSVEVYIGGRFPFSPFYMGLYGGSQIPGLLMSDHGSVKLYQSLSYQIIEKICVMQLKLTEMRPPLDVRRLTMLRRQYRVQPEEDPQPANWWEACTLGSAERVRYWVLDRRTEAALGWLSFWDISPLSREWGVPSRGMIDLRIDRPARRIGLATLLVADTLRAMQQQGVGLVETQVRSSNVAAKKLFAKFGFASVDEGHILHHKLVEGDAVPGAHQLL